MPKKKKKTLVEQGFHVYMGTFMVSGQSEIRQKVDWKKADEDLVFLAFGDESSFKDLVTYGIVVVENKCILDLEKEIGKLLNGRRFHCRSYFNAGVRKKTEWADIEDNHIWDVPIKLIELINLVQRIFSVGVVHYDTFPSKMAGGFSSEIEVQQAHMYGFGCQSALCLLNHIGLLDNKKQVFFIPDRQTAVMKYWGKGRYSVEKFFGHAYLTTLLQQSGDKPVLLDVADLFAYISSHALNKVDHTLREKFRDLYRLCNPVRGDYFWVADEKKFDMGKFENEISENWY